MCFYCHKLYMFPYAPLHGHEICPELEKIKNKSKIKPNMADTKNVPNLHKQNIPVNFNNKKLK